MKKNPEQRKVLIISELYPQHMGDIHELKRMILQSKIGGADIVKLQIYSSEKLWKDKKMHIEKLQKTNTVLLES